MSLWASGVQVNNSVRQRDILKKELSYSPNLWSTLAVASSITKIRLCRKIARARQTSWRCPTLKFDPDSASSSSSFLGNSSTACFSCTCKQQINLIKMSSSLAKRAKFFYYLFKYIPQLSIVVWSKRIQISSHRTTEQYRILEWHNVC